MDLPCRDGNLALSLRGDGVQLGREDAGQKRSDGLPLAVELHRSTLRPLGHHLDQLQRSRGPFLHLQVPACHQLGKSLQRSLTNLKRQNSPLSDCHDEKIHLTRDYGYKKERSSESAHFVKTLKMISLFGCAVHSWGELKARNTWALVSYLHVWCL